MLNLATLKPWAIFRPGFTVSGLGYLTMFDHAIIGEGFPPLERRVRETIKDMRPRANRQEYDYLPVYCTSLRTFRKARANASNLAELVRGAGAAPCFPEVAPLIALELRQKITIPRGFDSIVFAMEPVIVGTDKRPTLFSLTYLQDDEAPMLEIRPAIEGEVIDAKTTAIAFMAPRRS